MNAFGRIETCKLVTEEALYFHFPPFPQFFPLKEGIPIPVILGDSRVCAFLQDLWNFPLIYLGLWTVIPCNYDALPSLKELPAKMYQLI